MSALKTLIPLHLPPRFKRAILEDVFGSRNALKGRRIILSDVTANLYLGVAVTCLYTMVAMGLIIVFT